jgi:hypothetical protein
MLKLITIVINVIPNPVVTTEIRHVQQIDRRVGLKQSLIAEGF